MIKNIILLSFLLCLVGCERPEFLSNLEYPLWCYIVEILCVGGMALGVIFLFYESYKGITETDERIRQADCRTIAEHLPEYMAYKESIGEGADNEKLLKKFEEIARKEHER